MRQLEDFNVELAGIPVRIQCRYGSNRDFFKGYETDKEPFFTVAPSAGDIEDIRERFKKLDEAEGIPVRSLSESFLENNAIHVLLAEKLTEYDILQIHGSALSMNGEGIIFTAKSGTGKSTHARLWRELFGSKVLMINDDKPMVNVRDMTVCGTPWDGKHHLSTNTVVPLRAIVKLERDEKNSITPLKNRDAIALLMSQAYTSKDPNVFARIMDMEAKLVETLDFYLLKCNMEPAAAKMAWEEIIGPRDAFEYIDTLKKRTRHGNSRYDQVMEFLNAKARRMGIPMFGQFELTPLCNLDCRMCYVHLHPYQMNGASLLPVETWKDLIRQAFDKGMLEATLTGGECLTYPGFEELYLYMQSLGLQVTVMTNGVLLDEKRMEFFKEHPPALFQVTLYGSSEDAYERVTGSRVFGKVLDNLRRVKEAGIDLYISVTPNSYLGEDVFETIKIARNLTKHLIISSSLFAPKGEEWRLNGCDVYNRDYYARIFRFDNELCGIDLMECPEDSLPAPGGPDHSCSECGLECGGGRSSFVVNWKGELRICNKLNTLAYPLNVGFEKAWAEINNVANNWPRVPECKGCPYENVCDTCAATLMQYAPPGQQPTEHCKNTRYMVSRGVYPPPEC